jgi:phthiodiolone/phenolphthiodiolone dimycocerosates ketoreductase
MPIKPAAFLRAALPIDLSRLPEMDSGRFHSLWIPDHMVSFWPDAIWTPEFTDLATVSHSPHRHVDAMAVAAAAAVLTQNVPIATSVVDTVRRHPAMLAQSALTIDHLSNGRFILGVGSGETENTVPYGFDFSKPVSRFEESLQVIKMLWESEGPVDFEGQFYRLEHARLDTEPYDGRFPPIWIGCGGPRMLDIAGRYADGWWPAGAFTPEDYAGKLKTIHRSAERAGRDPAAITPCMIMPAFIGDEAELAEIMEAPLVKAYVMQIPASAMRERGFEHPLGEDWKGIQDINPGTMGRQRLVNMIANVRPEMILSCVTHGTPKEIAKVLKAFVEAGLRVPNVINNAAMAGLKYQARSAELVRQTEAELAILLNDWPPAA